MFDSYHYFFFSLAPAPDNKPLASQPQKPPLEKVLQQYNYHLCHSICLFQPMPNLPPKVPKTGTEPPLETSKARK